MIDKIEFYKIKEKLEKTLSVDRFWHSIAVANTAFSLALSHNKDARKAFLAGLLHDCAKNIEYEKMLEICELENVFLDDNDLKSKKTLHAIVGSIIAKKEYQIYDEEILKAISLHTTGDANMSFLDKIIFVADYIEPFRKEVKNLSTIRVLAFTDITNAVYNISKDTISYLKEKDFYINNKTIACLNFLEVNGIYDN